MRNTMIVVAGFLLAACSHDQPPPQAPTTTSAVIERQTPELMSPGVIDPASAATRGPDVPYALHRPRPSAPPHETPS